MNKKTNKKTDKIDDMWIAVCMYSSFLKRLFYAVHF